MRSSILLILAGLALSIDVIAVAHSNRVLSVRPPLSWHPRLRPSLAGTRRVQSLRGGQVGDFDKKPILVVGSVNVDIIIEIDRLPVKDETITARNPNSGTTAAGGKVTLPPYPLQSLSQTPNGSHHPTSR
jgi:hypothetical protein